MLLNQYFDVFAETKLSVVKFPKILFIFHILNAHDI